VALERIREVYVGQYHDPWVWEYHRLLNLTEAGRDYGRRVEEQMERRIT
jgi:hypothetical protein